MAQKKTMKKAASGFKGETTAGASAQVAVDGVPSGVQVVVRPAEVRVGPKR